MLFFETILSISNTLTDWYLLNKRDLPWRQTTNPYYIWLSEVMLQQTRVQQGLPYYLKFVERFPTIEDMAEADESEILSLWQGLGYYSRARNMHTTAQFITTQYGGAFPTEYKKVLALKGVGEYTAAAIVSFSYKQAYPVLDGNVYRVVSRLFNIETPIDTPLGKKDIETALNSIFDSDRPALFNQAIMEFGALQCTPKNPNCQDCVLAIHCLALQAKTVAALPYKKGKVKVKKVEHCYFDFRWKNKTYIQKRESGIWMNLHQFPLIEKAISEKDVAKAALGLLAVPQKIILREKYNTTHLLSHRKITANFYTIELQNQPVFLKRDIFEIQLDQLGNEYPTSVLTLNYWDQAKKNDK